MPRLCFSSPTKGRKTTRSSTITGPQILPRAHKQGTTSEQERNLSLLIGSVVGFVPAATVSVGNRTWHADPPGPVQSSFAQAVVAACQIVRIQKNHLDH